MSVEKCISSKYEDGMSGAALARSIIWELDQSSKTNWMVRDLLREIDELRRYKTGVILDFSEVDEVAALESIYDNSKPDFNDAKVDAVPLHRRKRMGK
jgi:hypothetical protein